MSSMSQADFVAKASQLSPSDSASVGLQYAIDYQAHLFEKLSGESAESHASRVTSLKSQLEILNGQYHGGLAAYILSALKLLKNSRDGVNPYEGWKPSVPSGARLAFDTKAFEEAEASGMKMVGETGFILVAGGLGERLGYSGIKIELPMDAESDVCYLEHYVQCILAFQERARKSTGNQSLIVPLCIMTSGDTDAQTRSLITRLRAESPYFKQLVFNDETQQISIVKQEKVPALNNNDAKFVLGKDGSSIITKPHGHGDIHALLHSSGTAKHWHDNLNIKWICFIQDTNGLVFKSIPAALGISAKEQFVVNSLTVPRRPGEPVGGICEMVHESSGKKMTINVEYNQLDPLLRATTSPEGDVPDPNSKEGHSPYPGNINVLVFNLPSYVKVLERTNGMVPEFVNPKYKDDAKTIFKKPTRLECMMQEYPKLLQEGDGKVGFTQIERWLSFSAVKNNTKDALGKFNKTGFPESASAGDQDITQMHRKYLVKAGVEFLNASNPTDKDAIIPSTSLPVSTSAARVILYPSFGCTSAEVCSRFANAKSVSIDDNASLLLEGDITFEGVTELKKNSKLEIRVAPGHSLVVKDLSVSNGGSVLEYLSEEELNDQTVPEVQRMRGYRVKENAKACFKYGFDKPLIRGEIFSGSAKQHVLSGTVASL